MLSKVTLNHKTVELNSFSSKQVLKKKTHLELEISII